MGLLALITCREKTREVIQTDPITFKKEGALRVYRNQSDSLLLELDIEVADDNYETQTGLMYREAMKPSQGMLFAFEDERLHSFYMKNTGFPLDLLFISKDLKVATISEDAQPFDERSISSQVPVMYVLELNAGTVMKKGLQPGDSVAFRLH
jgi:uncharacterized membrane protein (UPF0127 family)